MGLLSLPAAVYAGLMSMRAAAHARGLFRSWRPPVPCISVGNIRWGGTGKTPLCQWLLEWAARKSLRSVVLTRGYRAHPPALPYLVRPDAPPHEAGDEPLLLARSNPAARVVVDPKRIRSGPWAWDQWEPDLFLLDDGFQHLPIARDLNLVLLLPDDLEQDWNRVIPGGPWREGARALSRADAFLIKAPTVKVDSNVLQKLRDQTGKHLDPFLKPVFLFATQPQRLIHLVTGKSRKDLAGEKYLLVSGVADPPSVERSAITLLASLPTRHEVFADHHDFSRQDISRINRQAHGADARHVVCTGKDGVKVSRLMDSHCSLNWWRMEADVAFHDENAKEPFSRWLDTWWNKINPL